MTRLAPMTALAIAALFTSGAEAQDVSQAEIKAFVDRLVSCWSIAPEDLGSGRTVTLRVSLEKDGSVSKAEAVNQDKSVAGRRVAAAAIRAVEQCAPYSFPAESYEAWKTLEIDLQP